MEKLKLTRALTNPYDNDPPFVVYNVDMKHKMGCSTNTIYQNYRDADQSSTESLPNSCPCPTNSDADVPSIFEETKVSEKFFSRKYLALTSPKLKKNFKKLLQSTSAERAGLSEKFSKKL